ncbi:TonB-dependent receptor [Arenibacter sp. 6A1]|uniref:TonB-dependent receptor n=1 Tax=Arenibacter sp. 6A1 TaxID=2720391 RepID=UPI00144892B3|nr:TonB-dependent receptor [Arenibacter sp. 6A1]NKI27054.1 TonB-dependent receptor [Arenibacter sp. 6A1]
MKVKESVQRVCHTLLALYTHRLCKRIVMGCVAFPSFISAQELVLPQDSIIMINLDEVIMISAQKAFNFHKQAKPLSSLDEFLESSKKVAMVKRGGYAWEPTLNNMFSERLSVTIDGMRIFGACTDKMDPITSYVDASNLSKAHIASGQQGAKHGNTIGGAIDLELDKSNFRNTGFRGGVESGFEGNNQQSIIGGELNYSGAKFYADTDIIYRKAENYKAGGDKEVLFSQFTKYNISANIGYKLADDNAITASFIFDEARDVGYPALPMDVSSAQAIIGSLRYEQDSLWGRLHHWNSKLYMNTITHVMDDTNRPDVAIHMDMPGWSDTYGFFSEARLNGNINKLMFKVDGYYNRSLAEMTMYPQDPNEKPMFMLTWPDVRTANGGIYVEDELSLKGSSLKIATRIALQNQNVADEFGLNSLRIFYPEMEASKTRFLKSISGQWHKMWMPWHLNAGVSYGDRAPSVTEGYGFYIFNSFDNHDYVGDPGLKNEKSMEVNAKLSYEKPKFNISAEANFFHIPDYIIGVVDPSLSTMTLGADGVKLYRNLEYARLFNTALESEYSLLPELKWTGFISYHLGGDSEGENLPFISPLSYRSALQYDKNTFSVAVKMSGATKQVNYNPEYGEDQTLAYTVFSISLGKTFYMNNDSVMAKFGVENIFDKEYSTYTDWKNIPRMGRNIFLTLTYSIK